MSMANQHGDRHYLLATLAGGAAVRLLLAVVRPLDLTHRIELSSPLTNYHRLREGYHLAANLDLNPYASGATHHAPLLLPLGHLTEIQAAVLWTAADLATAYCLARIADRTSKSSPGWKMAALYLLHPFSLASALSKTTAIFTHLFVALSVLSAVTGRPALLAFSLSIATHLSLYPIFLLPPLVLAVAQVAQTPLRQTAISTSFLFALHQGIVVFLSHLTSGSFDFLSSVYGVILTLPDLTPTIGLAWYFFIEMFDPFRAFFVGVFQLHVFSYVFPLSIQFREDPLFVVLLLLGIISLFKSYPELSDFAFFHSLIPLFPHLFPYLAHPTFLTALTLYALALLPSFHHLWVYSGAGNANFFYASTLVWALAQGGLVVDLMLAKSRYELKTLRKDVAQGEDKEWTVVQR